MPRLFANTGLFRRLVADRISPVRLTNARIRLATALAPGVPIGKTTRLNSLWHRHFPLPQASTSGLFLNRGTSEAATLTAELSIMSVEPVPQAAPVAQVALSQTPLLPGPPASGKSSRNSSNSPCECSTCLCSLLRRSQADFEIELFARILHRGSDYPEVISALADRLCEKGWYHRAVVLDERLVQLRPHDPEAWYNFACSLTRVGRRAEALVALRSAVKNGFDDPSQLLADADLAPLRSEPEFVRLMKRLGVVLA